MQYACTVISTKICPNTVIDPTGSWRIVDFQKKSLILFENGLYGTGCAGFSFFKHNWATCRTVATQTRKTWCNQVLKMSVQVFLPDVRQINNNAHFLDYKTLSIASRKTTVSQMAVYKVLYTALWKRQKQDNYIFTELRPALLQIFAFH